MHAIQLKIKPTTNNAFDLEVFQQEFKRAGEAQRPKANKITTLKYETLLQIKQDAYDLVKVSGYSTRDLNREQKEVIELEENSGIHFALLTMTLKGLTNYETIQSITRNLRGLGNEEKKYWFSKIMYGRSSNNKIKSFRLFLMD